jgi:hypothetical protein
MFSDEECQESNYQEDICGCDNIDWSSVSVDAKINCAKLIKNGIQNTYITSKPDIKMFKMIYRRDKQFTRKKLREKLQQTKDVKIKKRK